MKQRKINKLVMLAVVTTTLFAITASPIFVKNAEAASRSKHHKSKKKSKDSKKESQATPDATSAAPSPDASAAASSSTAPTNPAAAPVSPSAPIRIAYINASEGNGDKVYATIDSLWEKYPEVSRIDNDTVAQTAEAYGITKSDLPNSSSRSKHLKNIHQMMSDLQADALVVVEVVGKGGKKTTLTTLDTKGKEIDQERKNIRRGKISKRDAKKLLDASLKKARPVVDNFRKAGGWTPPPVAPVPPPDAVAAAAPQTPDGQPVAAAAPGEPPVNASAEMHPENKKSPNDFLGHTHIFSAGIYGSFAYDSNLIQDKAKNGQDYAIGLPGGALSLSSTFVHFGKHVGIGASLFGGFSYQYMSDTNPTNKKKLPSYLAFGQLQLDIPIAITSNFMISPYAGGDFQKFDIKQDKDLLIYHGQQFIGARGGLMFNVYSSGFSADFGGGVVPIFLTSYPDKKYDIDKKSFLMAYEGRAKFTYEITPLIAIVAGYNFRFLSTKLTTKQDITLISGKPVANSGTSLDYRLMSHFGYAGIQFNL